MNSYKRFALGITAVIIVIAGTLLASQTGESNDTSNELNLVEWANSSADPIWVPIILPTPTPTATPIPTPTPVPPLPTPTPTPIPTPEVVEPLPPPPPQGSIEGIIRQVFGDTAEAALSVAWCESRFNPNAIGDHGDSLGLFQIHKTHWFWLDPSRLFEPLYNTQIAFELSRGGTNWSSWSCAP